jgi:hypothetical protein
LPKEIGSQVQSVMYKMEIYTEGQLVKIEIKIDIWKANYTPCHCKTTVGRNRDASNV